MIASKLYIAGEDCFDLPNRENEKMICKIQHSFNNEIDEFIGILRIDEDTQTLCIEDINSSKVYYFDNRFDPDNMRKILKLRYSYIDSLTNDAEWKCLGEMPMDTLLVSNYVRTADNLTFMKKTVDLGWVLAVYKDGEQIRSYREIPSPFISDRWKVCSKTAKDSSVKSGQE